MDFPYYPVNDFGPVIKGMVIGGLGIVHVFVAQFAIGGGLLMCYFQWLAQSGRCEPARRFLDGYFKAIVLISFVIGALTGVGMWLITIQTSARTIGLMVDAFHWIWLIEWTFFVLEIITGYAFYRYGPRLDDRARMTLLVLYSIAAWFSLFWVNGILSWQLTPGEWTATKNLWDGFFNPSFWPSLLFRTVTSMTTAALAACVVINTMTAHDRHQRVTLIHRASHFLVPMAAMPLLGIWYFAAIPPDSRSWALGGSAAMTLFLGLAIGASLLIGLYAFVGLLGKKLYINAATAALLCALALAATAGGEFVREGVRKPYTIREALFSNSITESEVAELRRIGSVTNDPFPIRDAGSYRSDQLRLGAKVFRFQCGVCHTINGVNGLVHLAGSWRTDQKRMNIAKLQHTKAFMPPFAGSAEELEALVQLIEWETEKRPPRWPDSVDPGVTAQIQQWLDEAGTASVTAQSRLASQRGSD